MLTDEQLLSSPMIRNIASRVRANGYAKTAAAVIFDSTDPTLPGLLAQIGTKVASDMHRQQQIRIGLASLETLTDPQVKHANFLANILKRGQGAAGAAAHSAVPEAEQLTHLLAGPNGIPALAPKSLGQAFPEYALEIPAYARQASEGGTFVPREMPMATKEVPKAPEGMKTKSRPTQKMDMPELPSMFRSGSLERGGQMGSGGTGIMAGGKAPAGATSFEGLGAAPQGDAPAMFNLADLMKGNKTASILKAAGIDLKALAGAAKPVAEEWRSVPGLLQNMPGKAPISPKLQAAMQGAVAPTPFSALQPVPQQAELAALMAGNKLAEHLGLCTYQQAA
jgi:hypothetical protein